jgi:hypothetical protein
MKVSQNTIIHDHQNMFKLLIGGLQPPKGQETGGGHFSNLALLVHPI